MLLAITVTLILLILSTVALKKAYSSVSVKELRRRARKGDTTAEVFYKVNSYGLDLEIFLWVILGLSSGSLFLIIANQLSAPLALLAIVSLIWLVFGWLPNSHTLRHSNIFAKYASFPITWIIERLQPFFSRIRRFIKKHQPVDVHTGMYTKRDIIELIDKQKVQIDNRVTKEELSIVTNALKFGDKSVHDVMTPKRMIKMVSTHDMVGPVVMDELHGSGHSRFPVKHDSPDNIVGTLYIRDLINAKAGGFIKDIMRKDVFYVNENQPLARVLDAFIKTKHHMFLVVNEFEEITGLITVEDIIEQVIGKQIIDEFDEYDDLRAVANIEADKDRKEHKTVVKSKEERGK